MLVLAVPLATTTVLAAATAVTTGICKPP